MKVSNLYPVLVSTAEVRLYKQNNLLQIGYEINIPGHMKISKRKPIFHDFICKTTKYADRRLSVSIWVSVAVDYT